MFAHNGTYERLVRRPIPTATTYLSRESTAFCRNVGLTFCDNPCPVAGG